MLYQDGTVDAVGPSNMGGDASAVSGQLTGVTAIYRTARAFAAVKSDGSVVAWGASGYGGSSDFSSVAANAACCVQEPCACACTLGPFSPLACKACRKSSGVPKASQR